MTWTSLTFGKHKGKTLPQVLWSDPGWFFWAFENGLFDKRPSLKNEAIDLRNKAVRIRIPDGIEDDPEVECLVHVPSEKFGTFYIVNSAKLLHQGSSPACRKKVIDLGVPRSIANYDKTGYKLFLKSLRLNNQDIHIERESSSSWFYPEPCRRVRTKFGAWRAI